MSRSPYAESRGLVDEMDGGGTRVPMPPPMQPTPRAGRKYGDLAPGRKAGGHWSDFGLHPDTARNWRACWILTISAAAIAGLVIACLAFESDDDLNIIDEVGILITKVNHHEWLVRALVESLSYRIHIDATGGEAEPINVTLRDVYGNFGFTNYTAGSEVLPTLPPYQVFSHPFLATGDYEPVFLANGTSSDGTIFLTGDNFTVNLVVPGTGTHQYQFAYTIAGEVNETTVQVCAYLDINGTAGDDLLNAAGFSCQNLYNSTDPVVIANSGYFNVASPATVQLRAAPISNGVLARGVLPDVFALDIRLADLYISLV